MSKEKESECTKSKESGNSCLMGPSGLTYIMCIVFALVFVVFVIWLSLKLRTKKVCLPQKLCDQSGLKMLSLFVNNSVDPVS